MRKKLRNSRVQIVLPENFNNSEKMNEKNHFKYYFLSFLTK